MPVSKFRDFLFEVIVDNEILHRFGTSHEFWKNYSARNKSLKKKLGYISIENIDYPCMVTVTVNPKEYFEGLKSENINKKHKGLRKSALGMEFEDHAKRINSIREIETFGQLSPENKFSIKNNEMILQEIEKSKFAQINDKRYYFSDEIVSLPFSYPYLHETVKFKRDKKQKSEVFLQQEKHKLIQMEKFGVEKNNRNSIYRGIWEQKLTFFHLGSQK